MPESEWLRIPHPDAKIIDHATFASVHQHLANFTINKSDDDLLDELEIDLGNAWTADSNRFAVLRRHFSSLFSPPILVPSCGAYRLIGYDVRPESRDPLRTEKGHFVRVRSPVSSEMD
jgi:hypothetical protein